jgi:hypothetical protein
MVSALAVATHVAQAATPAHHASVGHQKQSRVIVVWHRNQRNQSVGIAVVAGSQISARMTLSVSWKPLPYV